MIRKAKISYPDGRIVTVKRTRHSIWDDEAEYEIYARRVDGSSRHVTMAAKVIMVIGAGLYAIRQFIDSEVMRGLLWPDWKPDRFCRPLNAAPVTKGAA